MYQLFTDTDTDITPEIAKKWGYKLISMPYTLKDKDVYPYEDFDKFDYIYEYIHDLQYNDLLQTPYLLNLDF